jgi:hypothetical protein
VQQGRNRFAAFGATLSAMHARPAMLARYLFVVSAFACSNPINTRHPADASTAQPDAVPAPDLRAPADTTQTPDEIPASGCAPQSLQSSLFPVRVTVRGPKVEAETCKNGVGTDFFGPSDRVPPNSQDFFTTAAPVGYAGSQFYGFLMRAPADALSGVLRGTVGASAAEVGAFDSATNCGWLDFEVTLPVPPDVFCSTTYGPCDPGCEGHGEMFICEPANARLLYSARPSAACAIGQDPAVGSWVLTLTSVSAYIPGEGYGHYDTHGNLTATLVNQADATDSVVLNLDF